MREHDIGSPSLLDRRTIDKGNVFLARTNEITPTPKLRFSPLSSVFVVIPMYREYENVQRAYNSWEQQEVSMGEKAEVIFCINNPRDAAQDVKEDNRKTYDFLQAAIDNNGNSSQIGLHVIDKFSEGNALPNGTGIADIRNITVSPIVKHALKIGRNVIVLSTDADCFPSTNVVTSLHKQINQHSSVYGVIERELEYPNDMQLKERNQIEKLLLMQASEAILLEYLSYGEWLQPNTTAGSNTFYTINNFLRVDGYTNIPNIPEDTDLGDKLSRVDPNGFVALEDCTIVNLQRYSDRVDGDGLLFQKAKSKGNKTSSHAETTIAHARLRRWLINTLATSNNIADGIENRAVAYAQLAHVLRGLGLERIEEVFTAQGEALGDMYEQVYENAVNKVYTKDYDIDESLRSYDALIIQVLGNDRRFLSILRKLQSKNMDREQLLQTALQIYVLK